MLDTKTGLGMVQRIDVHRFRDAFSKMGRKDQFSYEGLGALFELLEELNEGRTYELDVIGLCETYSEYEDYIELWKEYSNLFANNLIGLCGTPSEKEILETIEKYTLVRKFEGGIIIQAF
jgi:hypothetical protein